MRTGGEGHGGISLLVIEKGTPGFSVGRKLNKMGWWASDTAELVFQDCRVPVANLLGEENDGFTTIMRQHREVPMLPAMAASAWICSFVCLWWADPLGISAADLALCAMFGVFQNGLGLALYTFAKCS